MNKTRQLEPVRPGDVNETLISNRIESNRILIVRLVSTIAYGNRRVVDSIAFDIGLSIKKLIDPRLYGTQTSKRPCLTTGHVRGLSGAFRSCSGFFVIEIAKSPGRPRTSGNRIQNRENRIRNRGKSGKIGMCSVVFGRIFVIELEKKKTGHARNAPDKPRTCPVVRQGRTTPTTTVASYS